MEFRVSRQSQSSVDSTIPGGSPALMKSESLMSRLALGKARLEYEHMAASMDRSTHSERSLKLSKRSRLRSFLLRVLESDLYSVCIGSIIVMNAALVVLEVDQKASDGNAAQWFGIASYVFLVIYAFEVIARFFVFRVHFFDSAWNCLDLFVVITDVCLEISKVWIDHEAPSVSVLRIFRLARLFRLIAMLSAFEELQTMLLGFGSAMKAIFWASFIIAIVLTVCSIVAVEFIHPLAKTVTFEEDCIRCSRAFETVMESNLTFIQIIIAGDGWGMVTMPIIEAHPSAGAFFLTVFGLIDLGLLNLILTVIVNAAESARVANRDLQLREKALQTERMKQHLTRLCSTLDTDSDGQITKQEFMDGVDGNEEFRKTLAMLDVQKQDAEIIYHLMDVDESGSVDYNEFVHAMISTHHETLNTKLLFLKANIYDLFKQVKEQQQTIKRDVVSKLKASPDVAKVVDVVTRRNFAELEFQGLAQKIDWRWEQLQVEQAKNCRMLEKMLSELSTEPPFQRPMPAAGATEAQAQQANNSCLTAIPRLPMQLSCRRCEVESKSTKKEIINCSDSGDRGLEKGAQGFAHAHTAYTHLLAKPEKAHGF